MTLLDAKKDNLYEIVGIGGDSALNRRLLDMGFTPDTRIFVAGIAPFGGTILVGMRGILVALREDAASLIHIKAKENSKGYSDSVEFFAAEGDKNA